MASQSAILTPPCPQGGEANLAGTDVLERDPNGMYCELFPAVNLRTLSPEDILLMLTKLRAEFTRLDYEVRKRKLRQLPDTPEENLMTLEFNLKQAWSSLEVVSSFGGHPLFYSPPPPSPPPTVESVQMDQSGTQPDGSRQPTKRKEVPRSEETQENDGFQKTKSKRKRKKKSGTGTNSAANNNASSTVSDAKSARAVPDTRSVTTTTQTVSNDTPNTSTNVQGNSSEEPETQMEVVTSFRKNRIPPFFLVPPAHWQSLLAFIKIKTPSVESKLQGKK